VWLQWRACPRACRENPERRQARRSPIEQASKVTFVVNLKTARALGVSVFPTLLALAVEAIE
jgi:hypothetical protein